MRQVAAAKESRRPPGEADGSPGTDSLKELLDAWVTPPHSAGGLVRTRLLARLDAALHHRLTLLSAAPGAGKTVLLAHWAASLAAMSPPPRVAWLTLGPECHAPTLLALALETTLLRAGALMRPFSDGAANVLAPEAVLVRLTVSQFAEPTVLILDGVEQLGAISQTLLPYLAEQAPPQLHLVLAARRGAALPLWVPRPQGALLELGDEELRWSQAEAERNALLERATIIWRGDERATPNVSNLPMSAQAATLIPAGLPDGGQGSSFRVAAFASGEPVNLWYTSSSGASTALVFAEGVAIPAFLVDEDDEDDDQTYGAALAANERGELQTLINLPSLSSGTYTLVARGGWSGTTAAVASIIR